MLGYVGIVHKIYSKVNGSKSWKNKSALSCVSSPAPSWTWDLWNVPKHSHFSHHKFFDMQTVRNLGQTFM